MTATHLANHDEQLPTPRPGSDDVVIDLRGRATQRRKFPTVTVIVPTLNEAANLPHVLPNIPSWVAEVIVVDGDSNDGTRDVAAALLPHAVIINEPAPGKGRALAVGFARATSEYVVAIDADGSTDPAEIPAFVGALLAGADFVKGSRFVQGGGTDDMEKHRMWGNRILTSIVNLLFKGRYSDLCYGYFGFRRSVLDSLFHESDDVSGFEIETFLNIRALGSGLRVAEVASFEHARIHGTSHLSVFRDGLRVARVIGREFRAGSSIDT